MTINFADSRNSYDMVAHILNIPKANEAKIPEKGLRKLELEVGSDTVTYNGGELTNELLNLFGTRPILSASNYDEKKTKKTILPMEDEVPSKILTGVRLPNIEKSKNENKLKERSNFKIEAEKMDVYMVDFDPPRGAEFGHPHPAIVYDSPAEGLFNVIPCSTKYREGKEVLELPLYDPRVLKDADRYFAQKSKGQMSYVIFREKQPVSVSRFIRYLGRIDETYFEQIERCYERSTTNSDVSFTLQDLKLNEKQLQMLGDKADEIIEIGNSSMEYAEKVQQILIKLGFYPDVDEVAAYLAEAIRKTKVINNFDMKQLSHEIAKGKLVSSDVVRQKMAALMKKRYKEVYPCLELFIKMVNKIAYYR